jgi:hypothetical protein
MVEMGGIELKSITLSIKAFRTFYLELYTHIYTQMKLVDNYLDNN